MKKIRLIKGKQYEEGMNVRNVKMVKKMRRLRKGTNVSKVRKVRNVSLIIFYHTSSQFKKIL